MNIDKRKYNRFLAQDDAFAALGFSAVGKVKDISMGGLAFGYIDFSENSDQISSHRDAFEPLRLSILLSKNNFYLSDVPCKIIYDINALVSDSSQNFITSLNHRFCGVKFGTLSEDITAKLELFLNKHATEQT
ncbi:MAG: hypothetical protein MUO43_05835 [Desulfobacterales bacterium]|nr:hypothetical protein [Desulfobacterales bacterium]